MYDLKELSLKNTGHWFRFACFMNTLNLEDAAN